MIGDLITDIHDGLTRDAFDGGYYGCSCAECEAERAEFSCSVHAAEVTTPEPVPVVRTRPVPKGSSARETVLYWVYEVYRAFPGKSKVPPFASLIGHSVRLSDMTVDVSVTELARSAGKSRSAYSGLYGTLVDAGYLVKVGNSGGPAGKYQLVVPDESGSQDDLPW